MINIDSMNMEKERLLVIAPHPDDEVLGCFGLMNKIKKNGGKVFVQILTLGGYSKVENGKIRKETWKNELDNVLKFMKIDGHDIGFYKDKIEHLDTVPQDQLIELLEFKSKVAISKIKPTMVAIPTIFSSHQDHVQTYKVAITALRPHPQQTTFLPKLVLSYESPEYYFWSAYSEFGRFSPNLYLNLSKTELDIKVKTFNMYKTQIRKNHRDGDQLTALARIRGSEVGVEYAEAYHIHRLFVSL